MKASGSEPAKPSKQINGQLHRPVPSLHHFMNTCIRVRHSQAVAEARIVAQYMHSWLLLGEQLLDIGLDIFGRDNHGARLAHQKLAAKVPGRIASAGGVAQELPELGGGVADDTSKLHDDAIGREVLLGGEGDDLLVTSEFLPSELLGREGKDGKVVAELAELLEPRVFTRGQASSGGYVGCVHHLALEVGSAESRAIALLCREVVKGGRGHGRAEGGSVDTGGDECLGEASRGED